MIHRIRSSTVLTLGQLAAKKDRSRWRRLTHLGNKDRADGEIEPKHARVLVPRKFGAVVLKLGHLVLAPVQDRRVVGGLVCLRHCSGDERIGANKREQLR